MGLSEGQARAPSQTCRTSCRDAEELETGAARRLSELRELLARPELDEGELKALVAEVSELRARSLAARLRGRGTGLYEAKDHQHQCRETCDQGPLRHHRPRSCLKSNTTPKCV